MEGLGLASGDGSVVELQHHDARPSNNSSVLSTRVRGGDGEGARVQKKSKGAQESKKRSRSAVGRTHETEPRDRRKDWIEGETDNLLQVYTEILPDKGRFRRTGVSDGSFWEAVAHKVPGRSWKECQRRIDTLTKSWRVIKSHLQNLGEGFMQLDEEILRCMRLATVMTVGWYYQMCEIKKGPGNARVVSTETGPVEEGDQSNATCPEFAAGCLVAELAGPVPHQQDPGPDILPLQPLEASNGGISAGEEGQLHLIPCLAPPVQALVPGAPAAAPPAPGSRDLRHDAHSLPPAGELDLPYDFAAEAFGVPSLGAEPDQVLEALIDLDGWDEDDTWSAPPRPADVNDRASNSDEPPLNARCLSDLDGWTELDTWAAPQDPLDLEWHSNSVDLADMDRTFDVLQFSRLPGF